MVEVVNMMDRYPMVLGVARITFSVSSMTKLPNIVGNNRKQFELKYVKQPAIRQATCGRIDPSIPLVPQTITATNIFRTIETTVMSVMKQPNT
ncbi:unnamed protein product [Nippostrongylus brasiliensis]|uniref:Ovule protein n=1 Tax=Nippostrongylus brasiliensis TaxID=27835 RepID=A0A0N4Y9Q4_NIPBR|nr:unnamed protein product [Nippostrongylus brasiliensis]